MCSQQFATKKKNYSEISYKTLITKMYLTPEQIEQTCGILLCTDVNTFIYYCTKCRCEFCSGKELEEHIVFDHHDEKKYIDGIFVDDGIVLETTTTTTTTLVAVPFVPLVETEIIPSAITTDVAATVTVPTDRVIDSATESIDFDENAVEIEQKQHQQLLTKVDNKSGLEVPYEIQNEAISIDEPTQSSSSGNSDCQESSHESHKVHVNKKSTVKNKQSHGKPQKGTFYCDMCPGQTFRTLEVIKRHLKRHVMNELRKPCLLCPTRPLNYEKHMQYAHTEPKPYKCDSCDARFKNNMGRVSAKNSTLLNFNNLFFISILFFYCSSPGSPYENSFE